MQENYRLGDAEYNEYHFFTEYGQISIRENTAYFHKDDYEGKIKWGDSITSGKNNVGSFNDQWGRNFQIQVYPSIPYSKTHNQQLAQLTEIRPVTLGEIRS